MIATAVMTLLDEIEACGAELVLAPVGRLQVRSGARLSDELRTRIGAHAFVLVALLCSHPNYHLTRGQIADMRPGWRAAGWVYWSQCADRPRQ